MKAGFDPEMREEKDPLDEIVPAELVGCGSLRFPPHPAQCSLTHPAAVARADGGVGGGRSGEVLGL